MNVLEKILEEIDKKADYYETDEQGRENVRMVDMVDVEEIIRSHMDDGKDTNVPSNDEIEPVSEEFLKDCAETAARYKRNADSWIPVEKRLPEDCEEIVLVQVSGKMAENIWFDNAFELATYVNGEGWILENYPECENPKVIAWQPLPEPYKPKK